MRIVEVQTSQHCRQFLDLPVIIYKDLSEWIRPLDKDIEEVFSPAKNKAFRQGAATRWLLLNGDGMPVGRIAAFINKKYRNKGDNGPVGGIGFFECINDFESARLLFDTAADWLKNKGMEAMDGPINFGERDKWWGLVTDGFQSPLYCMNYNPPYYKALMEQYGFMPFFNQVCFGMHPKEMLPKKLIERHQVLENDPAFRASQFRKDQLEKFAADFHIVYNKAWAGHAGNKEMSLEQCRKIFRSMKPVMDEKIIWFAYYNEEPIAIFINLPDLNQWFRYMNGKFGWFHKLLFLLIKATRPNKRCVGIVFGVTPEWQNKGVDSFLIVEASKIFRSQLSYEEYEMQWIGDFNPKMIAVAEKLTPIRTRTLTTYRYLFDREKPFQRHPVL
ncbi:hypothetical protein [Flavihumibacter solisilvae]|uniref:N-acetyltransferase domain-containing protein n=1 Tax=Flavihumibacter solisilvae TaxID=1349421 RepID=A0A0C1LBA2_9BACT|nr:hypothetical protein [Flavihumibacter solisilvae]KIC92808.1 hypothetical protein OI18_20485 [Flavihumibacter solisilvae]